MRSHIVVLVSDLFFEAKISETARTLAVDVDTLRDCGHVERAAGTEASVLVDLNAAPEADVLALVEALKAARPDRPVYAFLAHVQRELAARAQKAGADRVLPRSDLSRDLPEILRTLARA